SLFINASPLGMAGETFPYRGLIEALRPAAVYDMVYRRGEPTPLVRLAESLGVPARDGSRMLLYQALRAFYIWTGIRADPADAAL
ncbi:MAG: shikimate dehydrogenase, partial [Clostridia bacterium]|nr:shikimate dehydrogenase [Clostridia bacterium]